ncbi:MAG: sigma 54-interacting transcriptional regulator [Vicinamibacterales bacterium]
MSDTIKTQTGTPDAVDGHLLIGSGPALAQLRTDIESAARSDSKVLLRGETGVGKEVVARMVHARSARRRFPFLAVNCAGLPDELLESELFGHVRGSFTGAYRDKPGLAVLADKGTLFLDELGEMSPRMQGVLLRFLETGEIHPVGSDRVEQRTDVRVIAATNRDLLARIAAGHFREDLYYRLNVIQVPIPPLRERGRDILEIFSHYLTQYCRKQGQEVPPLSSATEALLLSYRWPGNVRELKNIAERLALRNIEGPIALHHLPTELHEAKPSVLRSVLLPTEAAKTPEPQVGANLRWLAADAAWDEMMHGGRSFWTVVHPRFINRELTKADVREIIRRGLEQTQGSYRKLVELLHLPQTDYKRFLAFLSQHDCHLPFHEFRDNRRQ